MHMAENKTHAQIARNCSNFRSHTLCRLLLGCAHGAVAHGTCSAGHVHTHMHTYTHTHTHTHACRLTHQRYTQGCHETQMHTHVHPVTASHYPSSRSPGRSCLRVANQHTLPHPTHHTHAYTLTVTTTAHKSSHTPPRSPCCSATPPDPHSHPNHLLEMQGLLQLCTHQRAGAPRRPGISQIDSIVLQFPLAQVCTRHYCSIWDHKEPIYSS
jgi:hypothetical protein